MRSECAPCGVVLGAHRSGGFGLGGDLGVKRPGQPGQHGLHIRCFHRATTPDPQTGGRVAIGTDVQRDVLVFQSFGHGLGKGSAVFDPVIGELEANGGVRPRRGVFGKVGGKQPTNRA